MDWVVCLVVGVLAEGLGGGQTNRRYKKLYILIFDSTDPDGWILCVESYFEFYCLTEAEMLEAIVVAMEGDTLWWFQCENKRHTTHCWADLKVFH